MAHQRLPARLRCIFAGPSFNAPQEPCRARRKASTYTGKNELSEDVEPRSSLRGSSPSKSDISSFDPLKRSRDRPKELPPSRYQYRSPRHYRGPLHPHQPPRPSDPASRVFIPGPFSSPRLLETYHSTLAPDLLTLLYQHHPPGTLPGPSPERLRTWDGSSPYHLNRPLRQPRGAKHLSLLDRPITFRNIPILTRVTVHSFMPEASNDSAYLHVAGMVVQAITNVRVQVHQAKENIPAWGLRSGKTMSVTAEMWGEDAWHFLSKVVEVVMPGIKEYKGVSGSSGDGSGNLAFGFGRESVEKFPEIEVNYDAYPPKMIPGIDVICHTTATNDKDARLLLSSMGVPFYGKHIN